ncbi:MAG: hypothetical protein A3E83_00260 [Gammaproteobacteria bacterium RIFCSPHIGHO2_12_FULL_41_20]|nr:MAG: hypothetical protein A3E83_00260 [Gammaproteobacteria bacterium RIFCSPHIGHO2_12_FULL_41_20]
MTSILVTGGAGFIGSHTVDFLLQQGWRVIVFDNLSTGNRAYLNLQHPQLEFIQDDVLNASALINVMRRCDAVLHLAALASVPYSIANPLQSHQVNTLGFLQVLEAIRQVERPIRLVYASSAAVYGDTTVLPCSEDEFSGNHCLLSPYALEKMHNEQYADLYARLFGINSLALRYFNVYGARQDPRSPYSGVISRFLDGYRNDQEITIFGDGLQSRDFIHIADVVRANYLALQSDYCGVLNVATGVPETLLNLVSYIEAVGKKPAHLYFASRREGDIYISYADTQKAQHCLQFRYAIPLEQGVGLMIAEGGQFKV